VTAVLLDWGFCASDADYRFPFFALAMLALLYWFGPGRGGDSGFGRGPEIS
jgi:hypothetical protein